MPVNMSTSPRVDCPYCNKATKQTLLGGTKTLVAYVSYIDEDGNYINEDRNIITDYRRCFECGKEFAIKYRANDKSNILEILTREE